MRLFLCRRVTPLILALSGLAPGVFAQPMQAPTLVEPLHVQYPAEASRHGIEGRAIIAAAISNAGLVTRAQVYRSSGHNLLDAEALRVIRKARFLPARRDGAAVATWSQVPVNFRIDTPPKPLIETEAIVLKPMAVPASPSMSVSITQDGSMYLGGRPVGLAELPAALQAEVQAGRTALKLYADENSPYGHVARLIRAAQDAGVAEIRFVVAAR